MSSASHDSHQDRLQSGQLSSFVRNGEYMSHWKAEIVDAVRNASNAVACHSAHIMSDIS